MSRPIAHVDDVDLGSEREVMVTLALRDEGDAPAIR